MPIEIQNGLLALIITAAAALHEWRLRNLRKELAELERSTRVVADAVTEARGRRRDL